MAFQSCRSAVEEPLKVEKHAEVNSVEESASRGISQSSP
jgi:hypothetical protein